MGGWLQLVWLVSNCVCFGFVYRIFSRRHGSSYAQEGPEVFTWFLTEAAKLTSSCVRLVNRREVKQSCVSSWASGGTASYSGRKLCQVPVLLFLPPTVDTNPACIGVHAMVLRHSWVDSGSTSYVDWDRARGIRIPTRSFVWGWCPLCSLCYLGRLKLSA